MADCFLLSHGREEFFICEKLGDDKFTFRLLESHPSISNEEAWP